MIIFMSAAGNSHVKFSIFVLQFFGFIEKNSNDGKEVNFRGQKNRLKKCVNKTGSNQPPFLSHLFFHPVLVSVFVCVTVVGNANCDQALLIQRKCFWVLP